MASSASVSPKGCSGRGDQIHAETHARRDSSGCRACVLRDIARASVGDGAAAAEAMVAAALHGVQPYDYNATLMSMSMDVVCGLALANPGRVLQLHVVVDVDAFSDDHYVFLQFCRAAAALEVLYDVRDDTTGGFVFESGVRPAGFAASWTRLFATPAALNLAAVGTWLGAAANADMCDKYRGVAQAEFVLEVNIVTLFL